MRLPASKFKQTNASITWGLKDLESISFSEIGPYPDLRLSKKNDKMLWHHCLDHIDLGSHVDGSQCQAFFFFALITASSRVKDAKRIAPSSFYDHDSNATLLY
jgi:hypothetical protein